MKTVLLPVLLLLAACHQGSAATLADAPRGFPYDFTPEASVPAYAKVRMEAASKAYTYEHALPYYEKWFKKKYGAPAEELAHFDAQRALLAAMAEDPAPRAGAAGSRARVAMVGDLMWIRDHWATFLSPEVKAVLAGHDAAFGNLETPVAASRPVKETAPDLMAYNASPDLVRSFRRDDGANIFTALGVANNHEFDQGDGGAVETLDFLAQEGIAAGGLRRAASEAEIQVLTVNGIRFGYYATTWGFNDMANTTRTTLLPNWLPNLAPEPFEARTQHADLSGVKRALAAMAAAKVDVKMVAVHWGHEFELYPSPVQMQVARDMVAAGADVIIGGHAHVQQPNEVCFVDGYEKTLPPALKALDGEVGGCHLAGDGRARKALVLYSLGNFTTNMWGFLCEIGMIQSLSFVKDAAGATDWWLPQHTFVHNLRQSRAGDRRLELLSTFMDGGCDAGGCSGAQTAFAGFVERHMSGRHSEADEVQALTAHGAREERVLAKEVLRAVKDYLLASKPLGG